jgi:DNA repair protein RadC
LGAESLSNKELLAIILKTGTKEKTVIDLSLEILNKYELKDLKEISINKLTSIKGIGEVKAIELLATIELGKRLFIKTEEELTVFTNPKEIYQKTKYLFTDLKQEHFYALYFDNKQKLISKKLLFIGTINQSITHPREIFKEAYRLSASSIICLHNHPTGDITPSKADIHFTKNLYEIGKIQAIPILDHIIIGTKGYYSFFENKNIFNI